MGVVDERHAAVARDHRHRGQLGHAVDPVEVARRQHHRGLAVDRRQREQRGDHVDERAQRTPHRPRQRLLGGGRADRWPGGRPQADHLDRDVVPRLGAADPLDHDRAHARARQRHGLLEGAAVRVEPQRRDRHDGRLRRRAPPQRSAAADRRRNAAGGPSRSATTRAATRPTRARGRPPRPRATAGFQRRFRAGEQHAVDLLDEPAVRVAAGRDDVPVRRIGQLAPVRLVLGLLEHVRRGRTGRRARAGNACRARARRCSRPRRGSGPVRVAHASRWRGEIANSASSPSRPGEAGGLDLVVAWRRDARRRSASSRPGSRRLRSRMLAPPSTPSVQRDAASARNQSSPSRVAPGSTRDVCRQAARPRLGLAARGDAGLEHPVPAEVGPLGAGPVEHVGRPLGRLAEDLADPRQRPLVEVAGERGLEAHALAVDARVDLRPLGRRRHREHDVDAGVADEVAQRARAQELVLRHRRADRRRRRASSSARARSVSSDLWAPAQRRQEARVEDDRVEAGSGASIPAPARRARWRRSPAPASSGGTSTDGPRPSSAAGAASTRRRRGCVRTWSAYCLRRWYVPPMPAWAPCVHRSPREVERQRAQEVAVLGASRGSAIARCPRLLERVAARCLDR